MAEFIEHYYYADKTAQERKLKRKAEVAKAFRERREDVTRGASARAQRAAETRARKRNATAEGGGSE